jgi:3,4-dihydroxy 2-butanone 4-phosphate synthase/GTP cyclohydrolase II
LYRYQEQGSPDIHLALVKGEPKEGVTTVRVHGFNPVRDLLKFKKNRRVSMELTMHCKRLQQRSWCFGLDWSKIDLGPAFDALTAPKPVKSNAALSHQYQTIGVGAQILRDLGVEKMKLLSSPLRFNALSGFNLEVVEYITADQSFKK